MDIKQLSVLELNINFNKPFEGGNVLNHSHVTFKQTKVDELPNNIYLEISFKFTVTSLFNDFAFKVDTRIPFLLSPIINIDRQTIFDCIQMTTTYLQNILNEIFVNQRNVLEVSLVDFDEISESVDELLKSLHG
jgi:hypothetical protein